MKLDESVSLRFRWMSFLAMIAILWEHSFCGSDIEGWFIPAFTFWAVPWFFVCSGFSLAHALKKESITVLAIKRSKSLIFPYLLWCIIGMVLSYPNYEQGRVLGFPDIFGVAQTYPAGNRTLWYLRELVLYNALTLPIFSCLSRLCRLMNRPKLANWLLVPMFLSGYVILRCFGVPFGPGSSPLWFATGILFYFMNEQFPGLRLCWMSLEAGKVRWCLCWIVAAISLRSLWLSLVNSGVASAGLVWLNNLSDLVFVVAVWRILGGVCLQSLQALSMSAFIYFLHYPIIRRTFYFLGERIFVSDNVLFLSAVCFWPVAFVGIGYIARRHPRVYSLLSGGR